MFQSEHHGMRTGADFEGGMVPILGANHVTNNYINHGQAGAFGENASATNFTQAWSGVANKIDLAALGPELRKLQAALQSEAVGGDQFDSVAAVAKASEAAEKGDGPGVMSHLAKAGKWALSVAEKIGVGLAVVAIKAHVAL